MTIPLRDPSEQPSATEWVETVVAEIGSIARQALTAIDLTDPQNGEFAFIEQSTQALMRMIGGVVGTGWAHAAAEILARRPRCEPCERPTARDRLATRKVMSLVGEHVLVQAQYVCTQCHARTKPADAVWKLGPGLLSPELSRVVSAAAVEIPSFERTAATVSETLGIHLATSTVARTCEAIGGVAEAAIQVEMAEVLSRGGDDPGVGTDVPGGPGETIRQTSPLPNDAPTLLVGADGARVFEDNDWREVKIGVVCELGPARRYDAETGRDPLVLGSRQYVAGVEDAETFFARLTTRVDPARDRARGPIRILMIGDGGPWIWARSQFVAGPDDEVHEILDLFHAGEHLGDVAKAVHRDEKVAQAWAESWTERLRDEGPEPVLEALHDLCPRGRSAKTTVRRAIQYFEDNASRMDYPTYATNGWPLGSGIVESTCRLVSNLRTKEPGMRWSHGGVQDVLTLRALRLSSLNLWQQFWSDAPQTRRPPVRSLTYSKDHPTRAA